MTKELTSDGDKIETARLQAAQSLHDACHTCVQIDGCQGNADNQCHASKKKRYSQR